MSIECDRVGGINLSQGVCDTEVPFPVREGAAGHGRRRQHLHPLRRTGGPPHGDRGQAEPLHGLRVRPETEVIVSAGATEPLLRLPGPPGCPGDEVVLFEPYYGYHLSTLVATRAVPVYVRLAGTWTLFGPRPRGGPSRPGRGPSW